MINPQKIPAFKIILITQTVILAGYTVVAFYNEGFSIQDIFIRNVVQAGWSGQFNLDFLCYLILSGIWIMWRNMFSKKSLLIALPAMFLGTIAFAPYLFYLLIKEKGNIIRVLIGNNCTI